VRIAAEDYQRMRAWFAAVAADVFPNAPSDAGPLAALDAIAARSPAGAREGLSMAIGDIVEMTGAWPAEKVAALDRSLESQGLPSLSEVRARFSKAVASALRRGRIKDEVEYHALRNAAEMRGGGEEQLWALLAAYEERAGG
jgi:hypothetical protein